MEGVRPQYAHTRAAPQLFIQDIPPVGMNEEQPQPAMYSFVM